jgi:hypothetical protein
MHAVGAGVPHFPVRSPLTGTHQLRPFDNRGPSTTGKSELVAKQTPVPVTARKE